MTTGIIETLNVHQFIRRFNECRPNSFSYEALEIMFEHLEEISDAQQEPIEFDPVALCGDFNEMTLEEIKEEYDNIEDFEDLNVYTFAVEIPSTNRILFEVF